MKVLKSPTSQLGTRGFGPWKRVDYKSSGPSVARLAVQGAWQALTRPVTRMAEANRLWKSYDAKAANWSEIARRFESD